MKRLISLLLAICLMVTVCVPGASASETTDGLASTLAAAVTVTQGVRPFVTRVTIYPAVRTANGKADISSSVYSSHTFSGYSTARGVQLSPSATQKLMDRYYAAKNTMPDSWVMKVQYDFYYDNKGSYSQYFEWEPWGDLYYPQVNSNGDVKEQVLRNESSIVHTSYFAMPEDTTQKYWAGLQGGFYYYCASARKVLDTQSGFLVTFNFT